MQHKIGKGFSSQFLPQKDLGRREAGSNSRLMLDQSRLLPTPKGTGHHV